MNEIRELVSCISKDRLDNEEDFKNLVICIFRLTNGSETGLSLLSSLSLSLTLESHGELEILWAEFKKIGKDNLVVFDLETLHSWAIEDNPERYNMLASRETIARDQLFAQSHW